MSAVMRDICSSIGALSAMKLAQQEEQLAILPPHVQQLVLTNCSAHDALDVLCEVFEAQPDHEALTHRIWDQETYPDAGIYEVVTLPFKYEFRFHGAKGAVYCVGSHGLCRYLSNGLLAHFSFPNEPPFYAKSTTTIVAATFLESTRGCDLVWFVTSDLMAITYAWDHDPSVRVPKIIDFRCIRDSILSADAITHGKMAYQCCVESLYGEPVLYGQTEDLFVTRHCLSPALHEHNERIHIANLPLHIANDSGRICSITCGGSWVACVVRQHSYLTQTTSIQMFCTSLESEVILTAADTYRSMHWLDCVSLVHIVAALDLLVAVSKDGILSVLDLDDSDNPCRVFDTHGASDPIDVQSSRSGLMLCVVGQGYIVHVYRWDQGERIYKLVRLVDVYKGFTLSSSPRQMRPGEHILSMDDEKLVFYQDVSVFRQQPEEEEEVETTTALPDLLIWDFGPKTLWDVPLTLKGTGEQKTMPYVH